ncbi:MAG: helix-turn-helix transcriptional regulator [Pseudomonadota bacterium]
MGDKEQDPRSYERLEQLALTAGFANMTKFADKSGIPQSTLSTMKSRGTRLSDENALRAAEALNISVEFFFVGHGAAPLGSAENDLLTYYFSHLPADARQHVLRLVSYFYQQNKKLEGEQALPDQDEAG